MKPNQQDQQQQATDKQVGWKKDAEQQEKCECKHKLHDIEGEPCPLRDVRAYLRNGKKVMLCGDCKTDADILIAPSIQREKCKEFWEKIPYTSEHLWKADHHGLASGNCTKCGMPITEWRRKLENLIKINNLPSPRQEAWEEKRMLVIQATPSPKTIEEKITKCEHGFPMFQSCMKCGREMVRGAFPMETGEKNVCICIDTTEGHNADCPINTPPETGREWEKTFDLCFLGVGNVDWEKVRLFIKEHVIPSALAQGEKMGAEKERRKFVPIFRWLFGYTDFPARGIGEGAYYWRTYLRKKLNGGFKDILNALKG